MDRINQEIKKEALKQVIRDAVYELLHDMLAKGIEMDQFEKRTNDLRRLFKENGIYDEG